MYSCRISKYNPLNRDENGFYKDTNEWTSYSDFDAKIDKSEYFETEQKYIDSIFYFIEDLGLEAVYLSDFEGEMDDIEHILPIRSNQELSVQEIKEIAMLTLREVVWCKMTLQGKFFVHFGYDYYMYIGAYKDCPKARMKIEKSGLFVKNYTSPYLD
ncbi:hypothetical protein FS935_00615 [Metabacillus litoralis]|uniref:Uncharacterized protein n=1 Tax=Metabacillus litoralis TaxID=152268 RepID=A0A5C6WA72_9BACI|nr:hypothetical protein [Metabacillus litoralis]TXC92742.1 hypothetical protein FS935_00615 [Metabacillus litoralis]